MSRHCADIVETALPTDAAEKLAFAGIIRRPTRTAACPFLLRVFDANEHLQPPANPARPTKRPVIAEAGVASLEAGR